MTHHLRARCGANRTGGMVLAASVMLAGALAGAQQADPHRSSPSSDDQKKALSTLVYVPHDYDAPPVTVSGGARGAGQAAAGLPEVHLLVPPKLALTLSDAPTLYWYLSGPSRAPVRVTVLDSDEMVVEPLLEVKLGAMPAAGVYGLSLAEHGVSLNKGSEYLWSVALEIDPDAYSNEPVAKTTFAAVEPDPALLAKLENAPVVAQAETLAGGGYWYDAIDLISQQVAAGDDSLPWRELRAQLLAQEEVGLHAVAAFDRAAARSQ